MSINGASLEHEVSLYSGQSTARAPERKVPEGYGEMVSRGPHVRAQPTF